MTGLEGSQPTVFSGSGGVPPSFFVPAPGNEYAPAVPACAYGHGAQPGGQLAHSQAVQAHGPFALGAPPGPVPVPVAAQFNFDPAGLAHPSSFGGGALCTAATEAWVPPSRGGGIGPHKWGATTPAPVPTMRAGLAVQPTAHTGSPPLGSPRHREEEIGSWTPMPGAVKKKNRRRKPGCEAIGEPAPCAKAPPRERVARVRARGGVRVRVRVCDSGGRDVAVLREELSAAIESLELEPEGGDERRGSLPSKVTGEWLHTIDESWLQSLTNEESPVPEITQQRCSRELQAQKRLSDEWAPGPLASPLRRDSVLSQRRDSVLSQRRDSTMSLMGSLLTGTLSRRGSALSIGNSRRGSLMFERRDSWGAPRRDSLMFERRDSWGAPVDGGLLRDSLGCVGQEDSATRGRADSFSGLLQPGFTPAYTSTSTLL